MLTTDVHLSAHLTEDILLIGHLFLTLQASKVVLLVAFYGVVKDRFSTKSESMKPEIAFQVPVNGISLNKILSYARLSRNMKRQKVQFIAFKTRTKRIGEARNCL